MVVYFVTQNSKKFYYRDGVSISDTEGKQFEQENFPLEDFTSKLIIYNIPTIGDASIMYDELHNKVYYIDEGNLEEVGSLEEFLEEQGITMNDLKKEVEESSSQKSQPHQEMIIYNIPTIGDAQIMYDELNDKVYYIDDGNPEEVGSLEEFLEEQGITMNDLKKEEGGKEEGEEGGDEGEDEEDEEDEEDDESSSQKSQQHQEMIIYNIPTIGDAQIMYDELNDKVYYIDDGNPEEVGSLEEFLEEQGITMNDLKKEEGGEEGEEEEGEEGEEGEEEEGEEEEGEEGEEGDEEEDESSSQKSQQHQEMIIYNIPTIDDARIMYDELNDKVYYIDDGNPEEVGSLEEFLEEQGITMNDLKKEDIDEEILKEEGSLEEFLEEQGEL